jgi:dephospho-CoA kinase
MKRIALTGGIATGKSHVRAEFERLGVPTIDADVLAREVVTPGTPALAQIVSRFGAQVLDGGGALNRRTLASIVFPDPDARRDLERIVHPAVQKATSEWFAALDAARHPFALADIPLLYEVGREVDYDTVVATVCAPDTQIRRLMTRDSLDEREAAARLAAQLPAEEKARRADYVIRTDGTYEDTNRQVRAVFDQLVASASG